MARSNLDAAVAALRDRYDGSPEKSAETEAFVLRAVAPRPMLFRRHRRLLAIPLVAVLIGSSAWAARGMVPRVQVFVRDLTLSLGGVSAPEKPALRAPLLRGLAPRVGAALGPVQKTEAPSPSALREAPPVQGVLEGAQGTAEGASSTVSRPSRAAPPLGRSSSGVLDARSGPPPSEQALYDAAHRLHFGGVDRTAAVEAWDRYLETYPSGQLAIEARYNRAIALARVGRTAEARRALAPFARGEYGGYRQREARRLIEYLDASSTSPASPPLPSAPTR